MDNIRGLIRGFDCFDDNPMLIFLILGVIVFIAMSGGDFACFFEQNNSLIWIVLIVGLLFLFNNNGCDDDCYC